MRRNLLLAGLVFSNLTSATSLCPVPGVNIKNPQCPSNNQTAIDFWSEECTIYAPEEELSCMCQCSGCQPINGTDQWTQCNTSTSSTDNAEKSLLLQEDDKETEHSKGCC